MSKLNEIKVFRPHSKKADFTVRSVFPEQGVKKLREVLDPEASIKAGRAFESLKSLGADSIAFHHAGRKIKIELAQTI